LDVAVRPALGAVQCDYVSTLTECGALRLSEACGGVGRARWSAKTTQRWGERGARTKKLSPGLASSLRVTSLPQRPVLWLAT